MITSGKFELIIVSETMPYQDDRVRHINNDNNYLWDNMRYDIFEISLW